MLTLCQQRRNRLTMEGRGKAKVEINSQLCDCCKLFAVLSTLLYGNDPKQYWNVLAVLSAYVNKETETDWTKYLRLAVPVSSGLSLVPGLRDLFLQRGNHPISAKVPLDFSS